MNNIYKTQWDKNDTKLRVDARDDTTGAKTWHILPAHKIFRVRTGSDKSVPNKENWLKKKEKNNYRGKGAFDILLSRCHVTLLKVEEEK